VLVGLHGEVIEHPLARPAAFVGLYLDVNQEVGRLAAKARFDEQVNRALPALGDLAEALLLDEFERLRVEVAQDLRQKEFEEVYEADPQQFFEKPVVIHSQLPSLVRYSYVLTFDLFL
jgi:hypothetical protein